MRKYAFCGTDNTDGEVFYGLCGQRLATIPYELNKDKTAEASEKLSKNAQPKLYLRGRGSFVLSVAALVK